MTELARQYGLNQKNAHTATVAARATAETAIVARFRRAFTSKGQRRCGEGAPGRRRG